MDKTGSGQMIRRLLYLVGIVGALCAQDYAGYSGSFLENGVNARAIAMGNALTSNSNSQFTAFYNPASTAAVTGQQLQFSHQFLTLDRRLSTIGLSTPLPPMGGISVGWIGSGVNNIQSRDLAGNKGDIITASENMFLISFGITPAENLLIGGSLKLLNNSLPNLDGNIIGKGLGFDFGAIVKFGSNINVGIVLKNLNASYNWSNEIDENTDRNYEDKFPIQIRTGLQYSFRDLIILGDYGAYFIDTEYLDSNFRLGIEFSINENYFIRGGLRDGKLSFGVGLKHDQFMESQAIIDYAIVVEKVTGLTHILSYAINF